MVLNNKFYDYLKFIAQIVLPALGTLFAALGALWGFDNVDAIVGTIVATDAFLGALLGLSSASYNRSDAKYGGHINVEQAGDGAKLYSLELHSDPAELDQQKEVTFKVNAPDETPGDAPPVANA